jgi:hypothetical protein
MIGWTMFPTTIRPKKTFWLIANSLLGSPHIGLDNGLFGQLPGGLDDREQAEVITAS